MTITPWASRNQVWLAPVLLTVIALALRLTLLNKVPDFDAFYHLLAAEGWRVTGAFTIADGEYTRAFLYTILIGEFFDYFGHSLAVARIPSIVSGTLLVVLVFLWTRAVASIVAAWIAALFLCLSSEALLVSSFIRFYALHALLFWLGAIGVYTLVTTRPNRCRAGVIAAICLACFALAMHLQILTLVGLVGLGGWAALSLLIPWMRGRSPGDRRLWWVVGGMTLVAVAVLAVTLELQIAQGVYETFRAGPGWDDGRRNAFWYYHLELYRDYPTFWSLFPIFLLIGLAWKPQPTLFCASVFLTVFLIESFGGVKSPRYIYFGLPFLFVLFGIGSCYLIAWLKPYFIDAMQRALAVLGLAVRGTSSWLLVIGGIAFVLSSNPAFVKTAAMVAGITIPPMEEQADWPGVTDQLQPWLEHADVVVAANELAPLYYYGRMDIILGKRRVAELQTETDFAIDYRTGKPAIGSEEAMRLVMACFRTGLVLAEDRRWRNPLQVGNAVADTIERHTDRIQLPKDSGIRAFGWTHAVSPAEERCKQIPGWRPAALTLEAFTTRRA